MQFFTCIFCLKKICREFVYNFFGYALKLSEKILKNSEMFPYAVESFLTLRKVSGHFGKSRNILDSFRIPKKTGRAQIWRDAEESNLFNTNQCGVLAKNASTKQWWCWWNKHKFYIGVKFTVIHVYNFSCLLVSFSPLMLSICLLVVWKVFCTSKFDIFVWNTLALSYWIDLKNTAG